jgi:hypothetical protein
MIIKLSLMWMAFVLVAISHEAGGQEIAPNVEHNYAQTARRVFLKLRDTARNNLVAGHIKTISDDFLGEKPRGNHKRSVEAVEELGVLLAEDAVPTIRKALDVCIRLKLDAIDFEQAASAALLQIGLSGRRDEDERVVWAMGRALALPPGDPESNFLRGYIDSRTREEGGRVFAVVVRALRDNAIRYDADRFIDLMQGAYYEALKKDSLEPLFRLCLVLLTDRSESVRRFGADFIGDFAAMSALPSKNVYENRSWLNWTLGLVVANAERRADVEKDLPEARGNWAAISEGLRKAIGRALESTRQRIADENKNLDTVRARLKDAARGPEDRASLQKDEATRAANVAHHRAMIERFQAALR